MRSTQELTQQVQELGQWISPVREQVGHVVVGQKYLVDRLLLGLLANGHILLEGVPGLAKTLTVKTIAACIRTGFQRLQFTPDLLPADLIGTLIYNPRSGEFSTKLGPIFSNLILADEINRAPAKVQSALLEAMQERQVTIGDKTYPLADPFLVLATENPLEQEGTYQLPEAQLDRFMLKLNVGYPAKQEERRILDLMATSTPDLHVDSVVDPAQIIAARSLRGQVVALPVIGDRELAALYSRATLLLFPSLAEGFGWPVLEAMACGCRVVTSGRAPMTEVGGDVATYIDPENPTTAAAVVQAVLAEPDAERRRRVDDGLSRASKFNSGAMAHAYLSVYHDIVGRRRTAA